MKNTTLDYCSAAVTIQCCWRGYWTRKQLKTIYAWYAGVLNAIDGKDVKPMQPCTKSDEQFILKRPSTTNCFIFPSADHDDVKVSISAYSEDTFASSSSPRSIGSNTTSDRDVSVDDPPITAQGLLGVKRDLTMELIWIQQAIESRKQYLQVKEQIQ